MLVERRHTARTRPSARRAPSRLSHRRQRPQRPPSVKNAAASPMWSPCARSALRVAPDAAASGCMADIRCSWGMAPRCPRLPGSRAGSALHHAPRARDSPASSRRSGGSGGSGGSCGERRRQRRKTTNARSRRLQRGKASRFVTSRSTARAGVPACVGGRVSSRVADEASDDVDEGGALCVRVAVDGLAERSSRTVCEGRNVGQRDGEPDEGDAIGGGKVPTRSRSRSGRRRERRCCDDSRRLARRRAFGILGALRVPRRARGPGASELAQELVAAQRQARMRRRGAVAPPRFSRALGGARARLCWATSPRLRRSPASSREDWDASRETEVGALSSRVSTRRARSPPSSRPTKRRAKRASPRASASAPPPRKRR